MEVEEKGHGLCHLCPQTMGSVKGDQVCLQCHILGLYAFISGTELTDQTVKLAWEREKVSFHFN